MKTARLLLFCLLPVVVVCDNIQQQDGEQVSVDSEDIAHHSSNDIPDTIKESEAVPNNNQFHTDSSHKDATNGDSADDAQAAQPVADDKTSDDSHVNVELLKDMMEKSIILDSVKEKPKVFSLTNFIKRWLNPVLQEFQEGLNVGKDKNESSDASNNTQLAGDFSVNTTESSNIKNVTDSGKRFKFNCTGRNMTENTTAIVKLVNSSVLLDFLSFEKKNHSIDCLLIMFYAPWCKFCAKTASQFNAVGRAFIQLDVLAVDAVHFSNLNARFGTVAVPNIMVFHNSRSAIRFNHTERTFEKLLEFVTNVTGFEPNKSIEVEEMDYLGPLSSIPTEEADYLLWCAWLFVIVCSSHMFINSPYGQGAIDKVRTLWQEHQHIE